MESIYIGIVVFIITFIAATACFRWHEWKKKYHDLQDEIKHDIK